MTTFGIKPAASAGFGDRLYAAMRAYGPVCVGIDPHAGLLQEWGLDDDANGVESSLFASLRRSAVASLPSSLRQRFSKGTALEASLCSRKSSPPAREVGTLCIVDAKRGDPRLDDGRLCRGIPVRFFATGGRRPSLSRHTWALAH